MLAFNSIVTRVIQARYLLAISVTPMALMFFPLYPFVMFGFWLDSPAGAAYNPAVNGSQYFLPWALLFLVAMIGSMIICYLIGWVINALFCRYALSWSTEKLRAVFLRSEIPSEWLKSGFASSGDAHKASAREWEKHRAGGLLRFILVRGVLNWGAPMFLFMFVWPAFTKPDPVSTMQILSSLAIWAVAGLTFGVALWCHSESNYRKSLNDSGTSREV